MLRATVMRILEIPLNQIKRPLFRQNDPDKVAALMASISEIGLQEPIDVLDVEGQYYGFSGCHRYEACQRLGLETIRCRVRRAPRSVLQMHLA
uniref:sulfiredoxin n=1 Tax=Cyanothece sp. (strain PCC 7425 / ATCC 29141) TaxID=395961 RepID=B8HYI6_CYAP4